MISRKKSDIVINTCVPHIKQRCKKRVEIPQKYDFFNWSIQNLIRKVKQFVGKYYIT